MFYKTATDNFEDIDIYNIKINSIETKEIKMFKHVKNRYAIDLRKTNLDFDIYDSDIKGNLIKKTLY